MERTKHSGQQGGDRGGGRGKVVTGPQLRRQAFWWAPLERDLHLSYQLIPVGWCCCVVPPSKSKIRNLDLVFGVEEDVSAWLCCHF